MSLDWPISEEHEFRGESFLVSLNVPEDEETLCLQVQSNATADQWRATFDKQYIEELTHKTGNFKQFDIFASMLENAITENSESVSLELLTYADLESLRSQKSSGSSGVSSSAMRNNSSFNNKKAELSSKRYLILIYSVEFDRIHYPLPLPHMGKPDPVALQNEVRFLKMQLAEKEEKPGGTISSNHQSKILESHSLATRKLKDQILQLQQEKDEILHEFELYKKEVRESTKNSLVGKEMKVLKGVIKNLESELLREKSRHQKAMNKVNQEYNQLLDEIEETKSNERSLRSRVKNMTAELSLYKKQSANSNVAAEAKQGPRMSPRVPKNPVSNSGPGQMQRYLNGSSAVRGVTRSSSRERERGRARERHRSNSVEDLRANQAHQHGATTHRSRSRSPSGGSVSSRSRFDPTAYIKDKAKKEKENQMRRSVERLPQNKRRRSSDHQHTGQTGSSGVNRARSSSLERRSNRFALRTASDLTSGEESDASSIGSRRSRTSVASNGSRTAANKKKTNSSFASSALSAREKPLLTSATTRLRGSTANRQQRREDFSKPNSEQTTIEVLNQSTDLEDIDARLNALQEFMKLNL